MTPEAQRIAIAEVCGWKTIDARRWGGYTDTYKPLCSPSDAVGAPGKYWGYVPDYLNDLNAIHEAEGELTREQWPAFHAMVCGIFQDSALAFGGAYETHATAAQRAEALLRTIGKWED